MPTTTPFTPPPLVGGTQTNFMDWLFSNMFPKPDGGFDMFRMQSPISGAGFQQMQADQPTLTGGLNQSTGLADITGASLFPSLGGTRLPEVYNAWQPWDAGTQWLADYITNQTGVGETSPFHQTIMDYGGFGGPGTGGMASALQFGAASPAGQFMSNLAQFGVSDEGAGRPLSNLAYGNLDQTAGRFLEPFLTGQAARYKAPDIYRESKKRGGKDARS